jgi:hypothetical protein
MSKLKLILILLLVGLLSLVLIGCKSTKNVNCDAYGEVLSDDDTIIMESLHVHDDYRQLCCWIPKDTVIYSDTLRLVLITKKNNYVR